MSSFCIKSNNDKFIDYFFNNISKIISDDIFIKKKKFKIYDNIFIHYKGNNINTFYEKLSNYITESIINTYENEILNKLLMSNYFYFLDYEQIEIKNIIDELISSDEHSRRKELINISLKEYFKEGNKKMILDGFITFRLKDYIEVLDYVVDLSVNNYLIKREYFEFIKLLKKYLEKQKSTCDIVHLIYLNNESILLDSSFNIINTSLDTSFLNKYSNIEFSSNDYSLNTLLNIVPKKLYIHLIDNEDEFIQTLIFEDTIYICTDCEICNYYKNKVIKNKN